MYIKRKLAQINARYQEKLAALDANTLQRVNEIIFERRLAIATQYGLASNAYDDIVRYLNQQLSMLALEEKVLELKSDVIELQIQLLQQAAALTTGNINAAFYLDAVEKLCQQHIARYRSMAEDRFRIAVPVLDADGNETAEVNFIYDEEKVEAETEKFAAAIEPAKVELATFCAVIHCHSNWAELARLNKAALRLTHESFVSIQDRKTELADKLYSLSRQTLTKRIAEDLTKAAQQEALQQKNDFFRSLHFMCEDGDLDGVNALLASQPSAEVASALVNQIDCGCLPLHLACQAGHAGIAKVLIAHGADPDQLDGAPGTAARKTAIEYALETGIAEAVIPTKALWNKLTELVNLRLPGDFNGHYDGTQSADFFTSDRFSPELERTLRFYYEETLRLMNDKKYNKGRHTPFHREKLEGMLSTLRQVVLDVAKVLDPQVILPEFSAEGLSQLCHNVKVAFARPMCLARNRCCFWKWKTPSTLSRAREQLGELPEQYRPSLYW